MDYFLARSLPMSRVTAEVPAGSATCYDGLTPCHTFIWGGFRIDVVRFLEVVSKG